MRDVMVEAVKEMKYGNAEDYTTFTSAVIDHNVRISTYVASPPQ
jgi:hypothetical protein